MKPLSKRLQGVIEILDGRIDWERRDRGSMRQDLSPMEDLMARMGHPERAFRTIHVAGSKGKGSVCALIAAGMQLPTEGGVFFSIRDADKPRSVAIAGALQHMGFTLYATGGTARFLQERGIDTQTVFKVREGRPDVVDLIKNGQIQLIVNTPLGKKSQYDELAMRLAGLEHGVPCITTLSVGKALIEAIRSRKAGELKAIKLQEIV